MKRLFLLICLCIVLGGFLVYQVQQGSGYVLIVLGETSIETSFWFALLVLLVATVLLWCVVKVIWGSYRALKATKNKLTGYSVEKAQQQSVSGLIDFIEGDWAPAHKKLTRSAKKVTSPIINYLAAARCAYEMNNEQEALQLLHLAEKSTKNSDMAVALTQARMQLSNQQYEQALATLARASKVNSNHNVVLSLQQQVYIELKDWSSLKALLPKLHQQNIATVKERYYLEQMLYRSLFDEAVEKARQLNNTDRMSALKKAWNSLPTHFQQDEKILTLYVDELVSLKEPTLAEQVLLKGISHEWRNDWVERYGLVVSDTPEAALKKAETWLKTQAKNPVLLLTLGRLCMQNQQWGRARDFFKDSLSIQPQVDTYAELARLQKFLGEEGKSQEVYRQGLLYSVKPLVKIKGF